jgi:hypothetical protein
MRMEVGSERGPHPLVVTGLARLRSFIGLDAA